MIKVYQLYSNPLGSNINVSYYNGVLKGFEADSPNVVIADKTGKMYNLFFLETEFLQAAKEKGVKIIELKRDITFDMFWDKYNDKSRSGKQEAINAWKKLSQTDQIGAFDYIAVYEGLLKINPVSKLHAASYLNKKRWIK